MISTTATAISAPTTIVIVGIACSDSVGTSKTSAGRGVAVAVGVSDGVNDGARVGGAKPLAVVGVYVKVTVGVSVSVGVGDGVYVSVGVGVCVKVRDGRTVGVGGPNGGAL